MGNSLSKIESLVDQEMPALGNGDVVRVLGAGSTDEPYAGAIRSVSADGSAVVIVDPPFYPRRWLHLVRVEGLKFRERDGDKDVTLEVILARTPRKTGGGPLPEITSDILARLSDVAPEVEPLHREDLLWRARRRLSWTHPRAPIEADFEGALRQRAIRLHAEDKKRGIAHLSTEGPQAGPARRPAGPPC